MSWDNYEEESFKRVYNLYIKLTNSCVEADEDPLMIAAILSTMGLSMYKTLLNDNDYNSIIAAIGDFKEDITKFENKIPKGHLH